MAIIREFHGFTPVVSPEAFVAENAALIGNVTVEKDASVWYGAVLRGDNAAITLGEGSNVQDNATVHCEPGHTLRIGRNVTVGHNAIVHCASIGDNTLIGMGARLLDGAEIGANCIIGAGAVVKENAVVPDGTMMVGVPAKAVRALSAEQIAQMQEPSHYVELSKEYLK